ncbi:NAD(P)-binding domain-containing protein [Actinosynnema sp. NPDC023587]|uniref:NADPH-dependent F420 reductase n=1 Tax=Actinosynnema sp. NPDC023587 TaxID=3154695 RepID=UPI0033CD2CC0
MPIDTVTTIGFIGVGNFGRSVARLAHDHGYTVVLSDANGPETLQDLVTELGDRARAASVTEAATAGGVVVLAVPFRGVDDLPAAELNGKVVIDTCNYYPDRDGHIAALDEGRTTTSQVVQAALPGARVVKALNHILDAHLPLDARPAGEDRRAAIVAGDDPSAKDLVAALIEDLGYDVLDIGDLTETWRIQHGTPGYSARMRRDEMITALATATRPAGLG